MRNTSAPSRSLQLPAPAKINLHLRIGPRRDDGFHPLLSWMATIGLFDILTFSPIDSAHSEPVVLTCDDPSLPCDSRNLVFKAAVAFDKLLRQTTAARAAPAGFGRLGKTAQSPARPGGSVSIHLEKRIPAGGGLGGGSSDAAATLLALDRFYNAGQSTAQLSALAAQLGSDVPFFLYGPSSICKGRGEAVLPVGVPTSAKWVTLVLPPIGMPTADVYRRFDEMGLGRSADIEEEPDWQSWGVFSSCDLLSRLVNDLEAPAFSLRPELGDLRSKIELALGRPVRMSGSGSSLFTLFDTQAEAAEAAERIQSGYKIRALAVSLCSTDAQF